MEKDWRLSEQNIRVQEVVKLGQTLGVTLTNEMLDQLKLVEGEKVHVEVREHELVIRKIIMHRRPIRRVRKCRVLLPPHVWKRGGRGFCRVL